MRNSLNPYWYTHKHILLIAYMHIYKLNIQALCLNSPTRGVREPTDEENTGVTASSSCFKAVVG